MGLELILSFHQFYSLLSVRSFSLAEIWKDSFVQELSEHNIYSLSAGQENTNFLLYKGIKKIIEFITMCFSEISKESFLRMQWQGLPSFVSSRKHSTKAWIF